MSELARCAHDAGVMPKGILSDGFGVRRERSRRLIGGIDVPMDPIGFVPRSVPGGVEAEYATKDVDLDNLLEAGGIDALICADISPLRAEQVAKDRWPRITRRA